MSNSETVATSYYIDRWDVKSESWGVARYAIDSLSKAREELRAMKDDNPGGKYRLVQLLSIVLPDEKEPPRTYEEVMNALKGIDDHAE